MIFEVSIIVAIAAIFVIIARKFYLKQELPQPPIITSASTNDFWEDQAIAEKPKWEEKTEKKEEIEEKIDTSADLAINQAQDYFEKGDLEMAERMFLQAATHDPDNARIYNHLGIIYMQKKNFADALEAFEAALKLNPKIASRHVNLGLIYMRIGKPKRARRYFEKAIKIEPDNEKYKDLLFKSKHL
jgi:Tfp pilus assembly protein PilF